MAFGLHLFLDAVSGGIAFYQPLSATVIGPHPRWIPYSCWWWCDLACIAATLGGMSVVSNRFDRQDRGNVKHET
jgi:hypothetical protein